MCYQQLVHHNHQADILQVDIRIQAHRISLPGFYHPRETKHLEREKEKDILHSILNSILLNDYQPKVYPCTLFVLLISVCLIKKNMYSHSKVENPFI